MHSVLGDFWLEIKHRNLVLLRKLQYIVLLNVKESPTQCINQSKSCTRFQLVSDPQVLPALTLYILDLQNDNNASIYCMYVNFELNAHCNY